MKSGLQRTPLFSRYADYPNARCIDFGGWELPVQFTSIQREHDAVRQQAGLFDVSHMGEFLIAGAGAAAFLQRMTTNDVQRLTVGQAQYSLMCKPDGGVIDDVLVYRVEDALFMMVVNAANIAKDEQWLRDHLHLHPQEDVSVTNASADTALLALQGPKAAEVLGEVADPAHFRNLRPFRFTRNVSVAGANVLISRTGYTGEDGFELYVPSGQAAGLWDALLRGGAAHGLEPAGLGARDTLRFEACLPLYGQELSEEITPFQAGLRSFVRLSKGEFNGSRALAGQAEIGLPSLLAGIEMIDRGIPRSGYAVYSREGEAIGEVTSGTQSPTLKRNLGLALLDTAYTEIGTDVWVDIRGKRLKARVVPTPFYKRTNDRDARVTQ